MIIKKSLFISGAFILLFNNAMANGNIGGDPAPTDKPSVNISGKAVNMTNATLSSRVVKLWGNNAILNGKITINAGEKILLNGETSNLGVLVINRRDGNPVLIEMPVKNGKWIGTNGEITSPEDIKTSNNRVIITSIWDSSDKNLDGITNSDKFIFDGSVIGYTQIVTHNDGVSTIKDTGTTKYSENIITIKGEVKNPYAFYGVMRTASHENVYLREKVNKGENGETYFAWGFVYNDSGDTASRDETAGELGVVRFNKEAGLLLTSNLVEREGSTKAPPKEDKRLWARNIFKNIDTNASKQFSLKGNWAGVQIGKDLEIKALNNQEISYSGITLGFLRGSGNYYDRFHVDGTINTQGYKIENKKVGNSTSNVYSLGAYKTIYTKDDSRYRDIVGILEFGKHNLKSNNGTSKTNHIGMTLSIEEGKKIKDYGTYRIQGQGQIIYHGIKLNDYWDNNLKIQQGWDNDLILRLGIRGYNKLESKYNPYITLNINHNLLDNEKTKIGNKYLKTNGVGTWISTGFGIKGNVKNNFQMHGDIIYEHNIFTSKTKRGWKLNIGFEKFL